MKKVYLLITILSLCLLFVSCGNKLTSENEVPEDAKPIGLNDYSPYPSNRYIGILLEDADFDTVKLKITDVEWEAEHFVGIGDVIRFEFYDTINDKTRKLPKYLIQEVLKKDTKVEITFTVSDAEYTKDEEGELFIKHIDRNSGWQIVAEGQTNDIPEQYIDDTGEPIYITKEEFETMRTE